MHTSVEIQQPMTIEQCFNFRNTLPRANEPIGYIRIYPTLEKVVLSVLMTPVTRNKPKVKQEPVPDNHIKVHYISWIAVAVCS